MGKAKDDSRQSGCPVAYGLDVFGDRWTLVVIRDMLMQGKRYYGEFLDCPERIASNVLADRLRRLEDAEIVSKQTDPGNQSKFIYKLTAKGVELIPMVLEVIAWGSKHSPYTNTPPELLRKIKRDRAGTIREIAECLKNDESFIARNGWV
jgi:DNA-binding HxlR family transcriptional regulator